MKETPRQQFRWAPHVSGSAQVKPRDYEQDGEVEAANEYEAWRLLRASDRPIAVGDLLESDRTGLRICKFVGFDAAEWIVPEPKPHADTAPVAPAAPVN